MSLHLLSQFAKKQSLEVLKYVKAPALATEIACLYSFVLLRIVVKQKQMTKVAFYKFSNEMYKHNLISVTCISNSDCSHHKMKKVCKESSQIEEKTCIKLSSGLCKGVCADGNSQS